MMKTEKIHIRISGKTPMLMHSAATVDPMSPDAMWVSELGKKRNKTEEDHLELSRREWLVSMYRLAGKIYLPIDNFHACLYAAAKRFKEGPVFVGHLVTQRCDLKTDLPDNFDEAWAISQDVDDERSWVDRRSVKVGQARLMRTRAIFREWSLDVELLSQVDSGHYERWLSMAGTGIGLGDFRPQKGGLFGQFTWEEVL